MKKLKPLCVCVCFERNRYKRHVPLEPLRELEPLHKIIPLEELLHEDELEDQMVVSTKEFNATVQVRGV